MTFIDMFSQSNNWSWFILAAVLVMAELILPGLFLLWIAVAAAIMGFFMLLLPITLGWQIQLLLFTALSAAVVYAGKKYFSYGSGDAPDNHSLNRRGHRLVGTVITVDRVTSADRGKARVGDSFWTISGNDLVVGAEMQVVALEGNALVVEKL